MPDEKPPSPQRNGSNSGSGDKKLTFVVTTNPFDASSAADRKRVRSAAALKSWPERRKKTFLQQDPSASHGGFVLDIPPPPPPSAGPSSTKKIRKASRGVGDLEDAAPLPSHAASRPSEPPSIEAEEELFENCVRASDPSCQCIHCRNERRYRYGPSQGTAVKHVALPQGRKRTAEGELKRPAFTGDLAMLTPPSSPSPSPLAIVRKEGKAEPFNCYPVPYKPWFDQVLHHMMTVFAPRGWPALKITDAEGLRWEWFMTQHALAEPALFYVRLLFGTGDLIRLKVFKPEIALWIQAQAIQSINEALRDPSKATSDAIILAVGRIALNEHLYGDKEAAKTIHRPAQKRMIEMRGGMKALLFPDLVKRLMRWADKVMAVQSGTQQLLEDDQNNENFSLKQHVEVLEKWAPTAGKDLRKKITISDLLSPEPS